MDGKNRDMERGRVITRVRACVHAEKKRTEIESAGKCRFGFGFAAIGILRVVGNVSVSE